MNSLKKKNAFPFTVILAFAIVYIVWGSTYFFIQKAIVGFPPLLLGAMRFFTAGIIMLAWSKLRGERIFVKKDIKNSAVSGLLMLFIGNGAVIWVEQYLPSAMVAIMVSSGPLWFVLLDKPKWIENFRSKTTIVGLLLGFAGVVLLFSEKIIGALSKSGNHRDLGGIGIMIIGAMAWAAGSLYSKYKSTGNSFSVNSSWQMLAAGVAFIPGSFLRGEVQHLNWNAISVDAWLSLGYLTLFGSIAAFSAYIWLLQVRPATQVSTYGYVNPVVAVLLGMAFANEHISLFQILGLVIILGSVLIINVAKYRNEHVAAQKESLLSDPSLSIKPMSKYKLMKSQSVKDVEE